MDTLITPKTDEKEQIEQENELYKPKRNKKPPNKKRRKVIARIIWITLLIAFLGGVAFGVWKLFLQPEPVFYDTAFVYRGMIENTTMGWGSVKPAESADIVIMQTGTVLESYVVEGDKVEEGDLLYELDSEALDKEIEKLQKDMNAIEKAIAEIQERLGNKVSQATVTAPFSGRIIDTSDPVISVGDIVGAGQRLGTLVDDSTMLLTLYYSYAYENDITKGMKAQIAIPASMTLLDGYVHNVEKVRRVTPEGLVLFEVEFSVKNPGALAKDMDATAIMFTQSGEEMIPADAGKLRNIREQSISSETSGKVSYYNLRDYSFYNSGAVLCRIDNQAEVDADNAAIQEYNEQIAELQKKIAAEEEKYEDLRKTAPISGTVMFNRLIVGGKTEVGQVAISIAQLDQMVIDAQIDERNIGGVAPGQSAMLEIWTNEGQQTFWGTVESVSFEAKSDYSYVYFPATITAENYSGTLLPGMGVNYTITTDSRYDVLIAPNNAVKMTPVGMVVFVKTDERPENAVDMPPEVPAPEGFYAVPVVVGLATANEVEILSGVEEGAEVFTQELDYDPSMGMDGMDDMDRGVSRSVRVG